METVVANLQHGKLRELAGYYAAAGLTGEGEPRDGPGDALGQRIATQGIPNRKVGACSTCHGLERGPVNPLFPALNGQYTEFTHQQLRLWKEGRRGGGPFSDVMATIAKGMTEEEMQAVARFYESLPQADKPDTASTLSQAVRQ
jgi:cytochrome c553